MGAGHDVTALYEVERIADAEIGDAPLATLRIRYKPAEGDTSKEIAHELPAPQGKLPPLSKNGHVAATAAALAMQLRKDQHKGSITPALLTELAQGLDAARNQELVTLVKEACEVLTAPASSKDAEEPGEER